MDELFGVPVPVLALALGIIFALFGLALVFIAVRNPILVRMAMRNVRRRPARGLLIIIGLMLATAIITSAFTTGDSITFSIKSNVTTSLHSLDEIIRIDEDSEVWVGQPLPEEFPQTIFQAIAPILDADPDIDGVLPVLVEQIAVVNLRSQQFEINALFSGLDPARAAAFDTLFDTEGRPIDLASLGPNQVYIDKEGAEEIDALAGDTLGLALGPGNLSQMSVKAIVDGWYFKREGTEVVLLVSLSRAQSLLGMEGQLSAILISNLGDEFSGVDRTSAVLERIGDLPAIKDAGLEVFDLKRELIDFANDIGSLFVSFFTTFGLFSIGVGLLLIFLIFSMLAAERKAELGMARAVGMQRRHLVRMFLTEGAIYGLGSSIVGVAVGIGLGHLLVIATSGAFEQNPTDDFTLTPHVEVTSVLVAFFIGTIITFVTVAFASWRISRLNIVRAIRDIPEPQLARAGGKTLVTGILLGALGMLVLFIGLRGSQLSLFGLGVSLIPIGVAMILRWKGVAQRGVLTGTGLFLVAYWLVPPAVIDKIKEDWNQDFSIFFISGALLVTGSVLVTVNNSTLILGAVSATLGRVRAFAPIVKSSVAYPLRFGFRTGLSVAMFAVVIFSITVMSTITEGFNGLLDDQTKLGGGYQVMAFAHGDLNPVTNLGRSVKEDPDLNFISRIDGEPSVGTFRTIFQADARLAGGADGEFEDTFITGVDDDFVTSNQFSITLATGQYAQGDGFDSARVWRDIKSNPGLAVVNALMVPTRNTFGFDISSDDFSLEDVEGLYIENDTMDPVTVEVRDLKSNSTFTLTIIGVLDEFASQGPLPFGIYTSSSYIQAQVLRDVDATQFFFNVDPGIDDAANMIEAAFFQHGLDTLDVSETIDGLQAANRSFFNLLIAFMSLGLIVGIAALGVVSARAVVERRHQIGVMRSIGFSRRMVQISFLAESSFIALMGIALGLVLGLLTAVNVISDIRSDEPDIRLIIPWSRVLLIAVVAYLLSLLTTFLPSRQAARIAPAEALRYE
ncbi:MAG: FtsX-like permease family protein [Dehalococcoidia bacterium]